MLNLAVLVPPFCLYSPSVFLANKLPAGIFGQEGGKKKRQDKLLILSGRRYGKKVNFQFLIATVPLPEPRV